MKNQFKDAMARLTNQELQTIVNVQSADYQPEALEAAIEEIKKREIIYERISKYSTDQILEILRLKDRHLEYEVIAAESEAERRNFSIIQHEINEPNHHEIKKPDTDEVNERYPALRFMISL